MNVKYNFLKYTFIIYSINSFLYTIHIFLYNKSKKYYDFGFNRYKKIIFSKFPHINTSINTVDFVVKEREPVYLERADSVSLGLFMRTGMQYLSCTLLTGLSGILLFDRAQYP